MPRTPRRAVARLSLTTALAAIAATAATAPAAHAETRWLCRPGQTPNPCAGSLATTTIAKDGSTRVETPTVPAAPPVDCFYVYPTVSNQVGPNATATPDPEVRAIAQYQAARFADRCRIFVPLYRQNTLLAIFTGGFTDATRAIAYGDVKQAFEDYLAKDNKGRGIVLIGHSQGSGVLRRLVRETFDKDAALRRRLVGALLLGGNVTVKQGSDRGGDFDNVAICTKDRQAGCVVAFSTFNATPPKDARFGRPPTGNDRLSGAPARPGLEVACVNPGSIARNDWVDAHPIVRSEMFPPGLIAVGILQLYGGLPPTAPTPYVVPPDHYQARCERIDGAHVLMVRELDGARHLTPAPDATWGLHLVDVNGALGDLLHVVDEQTAAWRAARRAPRLSLRLTYATGRDARGRTCARGPIRATLAGADLRLVRRAAFSVGARRIADDRRAPFATGVPARRLARGVLRRVVARLTLDDGRTATLGRTLRRC